VITIPSFLWPGQGLGKVRALGYYKGRGEAYSDETGEDLALDFDLVIIQMDA